MKSKWLMVLAVLTFAALAACGPASSAVAVDDGFAEEGQAGLTGDSDNALSIQGQLAAGTLLLEDTELAVDESQAAELLPLWQALQSLQDSDTAADAEIQAVANQIEDGMMAAQISAIADMALTDESLASLQEEGDLVLGFGGRGTAEGEIPEGVPAGGLAGGALPGGGPPGDGGGPGRGGGFPGDGRAELDPEALATRQAEIAGDGADSFQERALMMAVVRLLRTKTGEEVEPPGLTFGLVLDVVGEATGLSVDEIQAQTAEGLSLAELVEASGGDLAAVREALIEVFEDIPNAGELDPAALADQWLGLAE